MQSVELYFGKVSSIEDSQIQPVRKRRTQPGNLNEGIKTINGNKIGYL
jgi:hypothetical protein